MFLLITQIVCVYIYIYICILQCYFKIDVVNKVIIGPS